MPIISVQMIRGRTPEQKRAFIRELGEATVRALGVPEQSIRVILSEVDAEHWGIGTRSKADLEARS